MRRSHGTWSGRSSIRLFDLAVRIILPVKLLRTRSVKTIYLHGGGRRGRRSWRASRGPRALTSHRLRAAAMEVRGCLVLRQTSQGPNQHHCRVHMQGTQTALPASPRCCNHEQVRRCPNHHRYQNQALFCFPAHHRWELPLWRSSLQTVVCKWAEWQPLWAHRIGVSLLVVQVHHQRQPLLPTLSWHSPECCPAR